MTVLYFISLLTFTLYIGFVLIKFGVPNSVSASFYLLGKKGWMFQLAMLLTAGTLLPVLMEATKNDFKLLEFLTCSGVLFVAAAPAFKVELEGKVHAVAALVSGLSGLVWAFIHGNFMALLFILLVYFSLYAKFGKWVFWAELACFASVYVTMVFNL